MQRAARVLTDGFGVAGPAVLLAGPSALAFFAGGFFDRPRLVAGIVAWALVLAAAVLCPRPLPGLRAGRLALAGLAALSGLTALSLLWAPLAGPAFHDLQRLILYLGALIAAIALLRRREVSRAVEPALALGALAVVGYGLSERLLPGVVELERTVSAGGRLDQPLGYWNAMGALAGIGLVLCARLCGDGTRDARVRAAGAAASAPLGMGLYLSFSRGALAAAGAGLVLLLVLMPTWSQLRAAVLALELGAAAAVASSAFEGVESLAGDAGARRTEGALVLAALLLLMVVGAIVQRASVRGERQGRVRTGRLPLVVPRPVVALSLVLLVAGTVAVAAARERRSGQPLQTGAGAARFGSLASARYSYWRVALESFAERPLAGVGSGGFAVEWLRKRHVDDRAQDAHSLYLETAAELGLAGLGALAITLGGIAWSARAAWRRDPALCAGWCAAAATWAVHAAIDWDWEMPALTLVAVALAGALIAANEQPRDSATILAAT